MEHLVVVLEDDEEALEEIREAVEHIRSLLPLPNLPELVTGTIRDSLRRLERLDGMLNRVKEGLRPW